MKRISSKLTIISPRKLNRQISRRIEAVCLKAMVASPADRYSSADQLASDVARFLDGQPVSAYRENLSERAWRWIEQNRFLMLLIVAYMVMRILMALISR